MANGNGMAKKAGSKREENAKSLDGFPTLYLYLSLSIYNKCGFLKIQLLKIQINTLQIHCKPFQPYLLHSSRANPLFQGKSICSLIFLSLCTYYSLCLDVLLSSLCLKSSYLPLEVHLKCHLLWEDFPDMSLPSLPPSKTSYSFCNHIPLPLFTCISPQLNCLKVLSISHLYLQARKVPVYI